MLVIPAIDLRAGKCVRLTQGDYAREKIYDTDPASVARSFEEQGAKYLHVVDLDGAKAGLPVNVDTLRQIIDVIQIPIEFGGGIRSLDSARHVLGLGITRVIIGTKLVQDEELSARMFGELGEQLVAGIDAKAGKVAVSGWVEASEIDALDLAFRLSALGAKRFIVTDIARDGALSGPNIPFLEQFLNGIPAQVIASGGVSTLDDLRSLAALHRPNLEGTIVGKAFYEKRFTVEEAIAATQ